MKMYVIQWQILGGKQPRWVAVEITPSTSVGTTKADTTDAAAGNNNGRQLSEEEAIKVATSILKSRYNRYLDILLEGTSITMEAATLVALSPLRTLRGLSNFIQREIHSKLKDLGYRKGRGWSGYKKIEGEILDDV